MGVLDLGWLFSTVFLCTNGCFDNLHAGHIDLLKKASELVADNGDEYLQDSVLLGNWNIGNNGIGGHGIAEITCKRE